MLLLTRRENETIRIADAISVTVVKITGNQVKLAFNAPKSIPIHREEIYQRIHAAEQAKNLTVVLGQRKASTLVTTLNNEELSS
jgi:carbon storage regulator CsrA